MNPFEALGEGMQRRGTWVLDRLTAVRCRVLGHRWEVEEHYYGNGFGSIPVGDICRWCFKTVPYRTAPTRMTEEQAVKAYAYVRKYGKKWMVAQVAKFYIALSGLIGTCGRTSGEQS